MNGFSYTDIFATKGIEYLIVITFLLLLIPFWHFMNKQSKRANQILKVFGNLSFNKLRIPQGLFYGNNHTWMYMEKSGDAKVGLDDLLLHITGVVRFNNLKKPGETIRKGELMAEIVQNGKILRILSPVSGNILTMNDSINKNPVMLNEDPYGKGWIYKINPSNWLVDIRTCYFAEEATRWSANDLERLKDFLAVSIRNYPAEPSMVILQDGGELCDHSLSAFPEQTWKDFEREFLNLNR